MRSILLLLTFLSLPISLLFAQGPISGFMTGDATTDLAFSYSYESYNSYFFGQEKQAISNEISSASLFLEHGFNDSFGLVFTLPYLWIDEINRGIQDGIIAIKYRNTHKKFEKSNLSMITAVGVSFPMSAYPKDTENPIGIRATHFPRALLDSTSISFWIFLPHSNGDRLPLNSFCTKFYAHFT